MTITEFATLRFNAAAPPSSPTIRGLLAKVAEGQSKWSGYRLFYYIPDSSPDTVHLTSGWKSTDAHYEWIKSDENQELLRLFQPYIRDMAMVHLGINFDEMKKDLGDVLYHKELEGGGGEGWRWVGVDIEGEIGDVFLFDDVPREGGERLTRLFLV